MSARGDWRDGLPTGVDRAALPAGVGAIGHDSRAVQPGDVFICIVGERADGHQFAPAAVQAGAVALVAQADRPSDGGALSDLGVPVVEVPDSRRALSSIAAAHEGYPARGLTVVGVTGTDGKSTTAYLMLAALEGCGLRAGVLTTVGSRIAGRELPNATRLTTQEAPVVQRLLAEMVEAGCTHAIVEATSHGLDLDRLADCEFDVAVLTNLSRDHLDYHGSFEAYRDAKARLFAMLDEPSRKRESGGIGRVAVLNADDAHWRHFASATRARVVTYALDDPEADVRAEEIMPWPDGATFVLSTTEESLEASVRLPGRFNVANAAAAIHDRRRARPPGRRGRGGSGGCARRARAHGARRRGAVPGDRRLRPHPARDARGARYAARGRRGAADRRLRLRRRALARSPLRPGRGGRGSRRLRLLTEEDPRSEPSEAIIEEIARAMVAAGAMEGDHFERIPDRREAIDRALDLARAGDLVLLAGKGHEPTIERAEGPLPWDERAVARELIAARFG